MDNRFRPGTKQLGVIGLAAVLALTSLFLLPDDPKPGLAPLAKSPQAVEGQPPH